MKQKPFSEKQSSAYFECLMVFRLNSLLPLFLLFDVFPLVYPFLVPVSEQAVPSLFDFGGRLARGSQ